MNPTNFTCPSCRDEAHMYTTKTGDYYIHCGCGLRTPSVALQSEARRIWYELSKTFKPQTDEPALTIKRGNVYWCEVPPRTTQDGGITYIHYGRKPYVALSNERQCANSSTIVMVPVTTSEYKKLTPYHQQIKCKDKEPLVLGEQVTVLPREYVLNWMCSLSEEDVKKVEAAVLYALGIENTQANTHYKEMYHELVDLCNKYKEDEADE